MKVALMSFYEGGTRVLAISGTYVYLIEGGTNVGGINVGQTNFGRTNVGPTNVNGRKSRHFSPRVCQFVWLKYFLVKNTMYHWTLFILFNVYYYTRMMIPPWRSTIQVESCSFFAFHLLLLSISPVYCWIEGLWLR